MAKDDSVPVKDEVCLTLYQQDVRQVIFMVEGGCVPITVGETFTCRVTAVMREVVDRG